MGKILVLAEKPSVGRELAKYLEAKQGRDGFLVQTGSGIFVTIVMFFRSFRNAR